MMISKEDMSYLIKSKIKALDGKKNCKLNNDADITESIEDIDAQIKALTNLLEMI